MGGLAGIVAGAWLAWSFGLPLGLSLFGGLWWLGPVLLFLPGYVAVRAVLSIVTNQLRVSGGGLWSSVFNRRVIGLSADGVITLMICAVIYKVFIAFDVYGFMLKLEPDDPGHPWYLNNAFYLTVGLFGICHGGLQQFLVPFKIAIGRGSRPFRFLWRASAFGVGGSSRYAGLLEEWASPWRPGMILLGTSLYDPAWKVGRRDDRHFITIATNRSGKGRSGIVPNLLSPWPGSAIVVDPKGQNAAVTAEARRRMGQAVHVVDPFGMLKGIGVDLPAHRFNPLAEIDLAARDVVEQIRNVARALVMVSPNANPFWDNASIDIIAGVAAHVLTSPGIAADARHLGTVRDYVTGANGRDILRDMRGNTAAGGLAAAAVATLERASQSAGGDILTTVGVHIAWLDSLAMRDMLARSDFTMRNLKNEDATIYLVLPPQYLEEHARFLRLFITRALQAAAQGKKSEHSMLFIMDEFYTLGSMQALSGAAGLMSGFGVKLWPIVQNLSQIQENFPKNWETFLGNAGMMQVFAVNDQTTARYLSERLGHHVAWRKVSRGGGTEWEPMGATWFRTSVELARESSRDSGNQLVFVEGGDTFLLRRLPYDKAFPPSEYSPDPYEPHAVPAYGSWADRMDARWAAWLDRKFGGAGKGVARSAPSPVWGAAQAARAAAAAPEPPPRPDGIDWGRMGQERQEPVRTVAPRPAPRPARPVTTVAPARPSRPDGIDWNRMGQSSQVGRRAGGDGAGRTAAPKPAEQPVAVAVAADDREHDAAMEAWLRDTAPGESMPPPLKPVRKPRPRRKKE